jgi:hypothetical protein
MRPLNTCLTRLQKLALIILAVTQILILLLIIQQSDQNTADSENSEFVVTRQRRLRTDDDQNQLDEHEVVSVKNNDSSVSRDTIVDLLVAIDNDEANDDKVRMQKDFQLLAELVDPARKKTTSSRSVAAATNGTENDAGRRIELLERIVDLAKYKLKEISRRKKMEPAIVALTEIVERMKQENRPGFLRQKLSTVRFNDYAGQTSDE